EGGEMTTTLDRCFQSIGATEMMVTEAWKQDHSEALAACVVGEVAARGIRLCDQIRVAWNETLDRLFEGRIKDLDLTYGVMMSLVSGSIGAMQRAVRLANSMAAQGYEVAGIQRLETNVA